MEQEIQISIRIIFIKTDLINGTLFIKDTQNPCHLHIIFVNSQILRNHSSGLTLNIIIQANSIFYLDQHILDQAGMDNMLLYHSTQDKEHSKTETIFQIHKIDLNKQLL